MAYNIKYTLDIVPNVCSYWTNILYTSHITCTTKATSQKQKEKKNSSIILETTQQILYYPWLDNILWVFFFIINLA